MDVIGVRLDHVGVALRKVAAARRLYEPMALCVGEEETVVLEGIRAARVELEGERVELLDGLAEESVIGRFLARRGEGAHHAGGASVGGGWGVPPVEGGRNSYERDAVRVGAGRHWSFVVHPAGAGWVLVEVGGK